MQNQSTTEQEYQALPLRYAYEFLTQNGFENDVNLIKHSHDKYKKIHGSSLRRAKILKLLQYNNLLNDFINNYWRFAKSQDGLKKIAYYERIYNSIMGEEGEQNGEEEETLEETTFAYEEDIKNYLLKNLTIIEDGLTLYKDDNDTEGIEYSVDEDNKRIDILALDRNKVPVVIELKVSRGYERVIGQCLYYKNQLKKILKVPKVRVIIIAREITEKLKTATLELSDVELFEYKLSVKLSKISRE